MWNLCQCGVIHLVQGFTFILFCFGSSANSSHFLNSFPSFIIFCVCLMIHSYIEHGKKFKHVHAMLTSCPLFEDVCGLGYAVPVL